MSRPPKIPGAAEWAGYKEDLDVRYAHEIFFGREYTAVLQHFGGVQSISRADELLFMPRKAFQYYVLAFVEFLKTEAAKGDPESASPFLGLLLERERRDPGSVAEIFDRLSPSLDFVADRQEWFDADPSIYGDFHWRADEIRAVVRKHTPSC